MVILIDGVNSNSDIIENVKNSTTPFFFFFLDGAVGAVQPSANTDRYKANFNDHYWFRLSESGMIYF